MTVFGYRIERRFWVFIGLAITLLVAFMILSRLNQSVDLTATPAFPVAELNSAATTDNWIDPYLRVRPLRAAESIEELETLSVNSGAPFRARLLIPGEAEAAEQTPELLVNDFGWNFRPALLLDSREPFSDEALDEKVSTLNSPELLMVAFPQARNPVAESESGGRIVEVSGLLYGHSGMVGGGPAVVVPLLLAAEAEPLSAVEYSAPATHRAELGISFARGDRRIEVRNVQWASGKQVRVCVAVTNISSQPITAAAGLLEAQAQYVNANGTEGQSAIESIDPESNLAQGTELQRGASAVGMLLFPAPLKDPTGNLVIDLPNPQLVGPSARVTVTPQQFKTISQSDADSGGQSSAGC